jgi:hypothetical protein
VTSVLRSLKLRLLQHWGHVKADFFNHPQAKREEEMPYIMPIIEIKRVLRLTYV